VHDRVQCATGSQPEPVMAFAGEWMKASAVHSPARRGQGARAASRYARTLGGNARTR